MTATMTAESDPASAQEMFWTGPRSNGSSSTDPARWVTDLLTVLGAQRHGRKWQCPAHGLTGEHSTSLVVDRGEDGQLLLHCHAGCGYREILRALHVTGTVLQIAPPTPPSRHARAHLRNLKFPPPTSGSGSPATRGFRFESEHPYGDDVWLVRLRHPSGAKEVTWESRNPHGERVPGLLGRRGKDLPLYCEREIGMAVAADETVHVVESESSVDALRKAGLYACTWAGGAGSPNVERLAAVLNPAAHVVVVPDFDDPGLQCLTKIRAAMPGARVLLGQVGEDARDLLARVGPAEFRGLVETVLG